MHRDICVANGLKQLVYQSRFQSNRAAHLSALFTPAHLRALGLQARVGRGGVELVRANVVLNELVDASALSGTTEYVNWKFIPSVKNGAPPDVNQLTLTELTNFVPD